MQVRSMFGLRCTGPLEKPHTVKDLPPSGSYPACILAGIAGFLLIFAAASMNAGYAWQLGIGHSEFRALVLAGASTGAAVLAPLSLLAASTTARQGRFGTAVVMVLLGLAAIAYTSISSLGFVAGSRADGISERTIAADTYADRRALADAARKELAGLKGQKVEILERRAELTAILVDLTTVERPTARPAQRDAQAAALGTYLRAAGWHVADDAVGVWLSLGMVLALEVFAGLSLTVAGALYPRPVGAPPAHTLPGPSPTPSAPADRTPAQPPPKRGGKGDDLDDNPPPKGKAGRKPTVLPQEALDRLRRKGGKVSGSLNGIAKLVGSRSRTSAHRLLHAMETSGLIRLHTSPAGTAVAII